MYRILGRAIQLGTEGGSAVGPDQVDVIDAQSLRQFVQRNHRWVSVPLFQAAQILLAEAGAIGHILLRQALLATQASEVSSNQSAHVHRENLCRVPSRRPGPGIANQATWSRNLTPLHLGGGVLATRGSAACLDFREMQAHQS